MAATRLERDSVVRLGGAERVTELLRKRIAAGSLVPGTRLSEERLSAALGVSRNTLREAFRLLGHEHLVVHQFNRGVFVRELTASDVTDIFLMRAVVEVAALDLAQLRAALTFDQVVRAVERAEAAALRGKWADVATFDLQFHQEIVALAASARLNGLMERLMTELRLAFHVMTSPTEFHEPYLRRNRTILTLLQRGRFDAARTELRSYLSDAQAQLLAAFHAR